MTFYSRGLSPPVIVFCILKSNGANQTPSSAAEAAEVQKGEFTSPGSRIVLAKSNSLYSSESSKAGPAARPTPRSVAPLLSGSALTASSGADLAGFPFCVGLLRVYLENQTPFKVFRGGGRVGRGESQVQKSCTCVPFP